MPFPGSLPTDTPETAGIEETQLRQSFGQLEGPTDLDADCQVIISTGLGSCQDKLKECVALTPDNDNKFSSRIEP